MPADVKANTKQQEKKDLVAYLTNVYKSYLYNLKYKKGVYFSVDFAWYSIHLDIVCEEQGGWVVFAY